MKLNLLLIFGLSLLIGSCTKKAEETVLKQVSAEGVVFKESAEALSPLALMRTPLAAVATVHDQSITLQDVQPGRALQDLSQEIVDLQAAMVVGWASDKSASEAVFYGQPTPQGMALALKRLGLNLPPDLNLSYSEVTEETQGVEKVWVTDTIPLRAEARECPKFEVISVAPVVAEAIKRITNYDSVSALFD